MDDTPKPAPTAAAEADRTSEPAWVAAAPAVFVLLWSTGFLGAKMGAPHAEPFTFLSIRFVIAAALFGGVCLAFRAEWPRAAAEVRHAIVSGWLVHGVHLGGVFWAIDNGVSAGTTAIIVGIHPLLTAVGAGPYLGERVTVRQWLGFGLGLVGIGLVVWDKVAVDIGQWPGLLSCVVALTGLSFGTLYSKRHGESTHLRTGSTLQLAAAAVLLVPLALAFETGDIAWTGEFVFALIWLTVVMSVGAFTLMYFLIRRGAASRVVGLFYLVPPLVALEAYFLFGETITPTTVAGMGLAVLAVALVTRN